MAVGAVVTAIGAVYTYVDCAGTNARVVDVHDAGEAALSRVEDEGREEDGAREGSRKECTPIVIKVSIVGSYQRVWHLKSGALNMPSLVAEHFVAEDPALEATLRTTIRFPLAWPNFAAPYSIQDLCSTEEVSPLWLRFACIDLQNKLSTIEYRIVGGRTLVISEGGNVHPLSDNASINTPLPANACATLETSITKRDLKPLEKAYKNNNPSERCRTSTAPRRRIRATLSHQPLPKGHDLYEMGKLEQVHYPTTRLCRAITQVRLILPPSVAPSQDLGILGAQCTGLCSASREINPGSIYATCDEGGKVEAYQLGDHLYVVEEDHVRQVPLPCDVDLDFRIDDFAVQLGLPRPKE